MTFDLISHYWPLLWQGLKVTIQIWFVAALISLVMGAVLGVVRCRRLRLSSLSRFVDAITFVLRGVPFYVQLLIAYYVLPDILGFGLSPVVAGMISLGLCSAAYVSQMVCGSIDAITDDLWETSFVLGLNKMQTLRKIILPTAGRTILPMLCGEFDQLLKSTSIISAIGVLELTRAGMNIIARDMQVVFVYIAIALLYLALSTALTAGSALIERRWVNASR